MDNLEKQEKEKYTNAWKCGAEGQSKTAWYVFNYLKNTLDKNYKILDLGCGNGLVVELLKQEGYNTIGVDITLEGLKQYTPMIKFTPEIKLTPKIENYFEAPLWKLPFENNQFNFTFSSDVLEHIPEELVEQSIKEIIRITNRRTFHCIATFRDNRKGYNFHLTVKPIEWWREQFNKFNDKSILIEIIDRKEFLKENKC
jgi:SAM-dependent methyltransferase